MRHLMTSIAVAVSLLTAIPAYAATQRDYDDCNQSADADRRIRGCTAIAQDRKESRSNQVNALNNRGLAYRQKGDPDRALADYSEAIKLDPKYGPAYNNRGQIYQDKRDHDRALADLDQAIRINPDATRYTNRGRSHYDKRDVSKALADFDSAIKLDAKHAEAYYRRGIIAGDKDDHDAAIKDFSEAIRLFPRYADAYYQRASAWGEKDEHDRSIADYLEAIKLNPRWPAPYIDGAFRYNQKGDHDNAVKLANQVLAFMPENSFALRQRADGYAGKKQYDLGIADLTEALRLTNVDFIDAQIHSQRAEIFRRKGDDDRALADYADAIRLMPSFNRSAIVQAHYGRGYIYESRGDSDDAIAAYGAAIALTPTYAAALVNRGSVLIAKGEYDKAVADYSAVLKEDPKQDGALWGRSRAYLHAGALDKALADISRAADISPKDAYVVLWLDIIERRNKLPGRLHQAIANLDMTEWPAPAARLYLGQLTLAAMLASADHTDPETRKGQVCEANFFGGIHALRQEAKDEAARLFRQAVEGCPKTFIEWGSAKAELAALEASR